MDLKSLSKLPSPFYRVSVKALIFDDQKRLLVGRGEQDPRPGWSGWEMPGGGFEHNESLEECVKRELKEELGVEAESVSPILFIYRGKSVHGWTILRITVSAKLKNFEFKPGDMIEVKFVDKKEFLSLNFAADEGTIKDYVDRIWPPEA